MFDTGNGVGLRSTLHALRSMLRGYPCPTFVAISYWSVEMEEGEPTTLVRYKVVRI